MLKLELKIGQTENGIDWNEIDWNGENTEKIISCQKKLEILGIIVHSWIIYRKEIENNYDNWKSTIKERSLFSKETFNEIRNYMYYDSSCLGKCQHFQWHDVLSVLDRVTTQALPGPGENLVINQGQSPARPKYLPRPRPKTIHMPGAQPGI